eukprot:COSAG02_NODE_25195_length_666_cov_0.880071_1_plen_34_part_10
MLQSSMQWLLAHSSIEPNLDHATSRFDERENQFC